MSTIEREKLNHQIVKFQPLFNVYNLGISIYTRRSTKRSRVFVQNFDNFEAGHGGITGNNQTLASKFTPTQIVVTSPCYSSSPEISGRAGNENKYPQVWHRSDLLYQSVFGEGKRARDGGQEGWERLVHTWKLMCLAVALFSIDRVGIWGSSTRKVRGGEKCQR